MLLRPTLNNRRCVSDARVGIAAVVLVVVASCGSTADNSGPVSDTSPGATPKSTTVTSTTPTSTTPTSTTSEGSLSLVGLGDSLPGALNCSGCTSYVVLYGGAAATTLGRKVEVTNLATNDSLESGQLLARIRSDKKHEDAIASADILTLQVGFNDWQGPCNWPNDDDCFTRGSAGVEQNLAAILDEVSKLRDGKPTAIRVLTYYNMFLGDLISPTPPLADPVFQAYWAEHLKDFNAVLCGVARSKGAICVDLVPAFNGPTGDAPAKELVGSDNVHPTQLGHQLIATTLDAAGYAPLG